jgi:hypothetical protein
MITKSASDLRDLLATLAGLSELPMRANIDQTISTDPFRPDNPTPENPVIKVNRLLTILGAESEPVSRFDVPTRGGSR